MNIDTINFDQDNFRERRASQNGAGVAYDPDSLITGTEVEAGLDYENSTRSFDTPKHDKQAKQGKLSTRKVLQFGPRTLKPDHALNTSEHAEATIASGRFNWYEGEGE